MQLTHKLNPSQAEAVEYCSGPLLILAGAGSGKTRVLTHRIAHLIRNKGVAPYNILAITFTNKAAQEMKERVERLLGNQADHMWICTFHSACVRILRKEIGALGYDTSFVIYDSADQQTLIKQCLKELNIDDKRFPPRAVGAGISQAKNSLTGPEAYEKKAADHYQQTVSSVYQLYQKKLYTNNALDFDDLIMKTVILFQKYPDILESYQERFKYILIDEYQDTNHAQYRLVRLLAEKYRNICVVGDDDQSVYRFRGADIKNILDFERDYSETRVVRLEQNYRSTKNILEAANEVIRNNIGRKKKRLWTENQEGTPVRLFTAQDEHQEAYYAARKIVEGHDQQDRAYRDFAVLYRTNAQSRVVEEVLMRNNIPYTIIGGLKFYDRKEIKDIMAYLKVVCNTADSVGLQRIINVPRRGIGDASLARVYAYAAENGLSLYSALSEVELVPKLQTRAVKPLQGFYSLIEEFREKKDGISVTDLTKEILDKSGYMRELQGEKTVEAETRIENIKEFLTVTAEYDSGREEGSLEEFLAEVSLVSDIDNMKEDTDVVVLMTLHSAKGLEFPVVFMIGMEDGIFPHSRSIGEEAELEEERRLCYVGITRAREEIYLLNANQRTLYGNFMHNAPSRFIREIPEGLTETVDTGGAGATGMPRDGFRQESRWGSRSAGSGGRSAGLGGLNSYGSASGASGGTGMGSVVPGSYRLGDKVEHAKWGQGVVVSVKGENDDAEISVAFPGLGIKTLIAKYAPLRKV
ncbi:DNA helicase PcrA [Phosphitispora fastidiosa]|uniref:DNA helicase PcrA n=1 Tax=Phosphitispora fastidiosa TaxID=2837202 RepID=UPI001E6061F1|nr:DNA helicase PcrA [Phosphitispora fastidiosa]MBU7008672.1 DNA helicase-2/ATP-dependent DNA helicase PcrA [Phosphitispora fastidiosa]